MLFGVKKVDHMSSSIDHIYSFRRQNTKLDHIDILNTDNSLSYLLIYQGMFSHNEEKHVQLCKYIEEIYTYIKRCLSVLSIHVLERMFISISTKY